MADHLNCILDFPYVCSEKSIEDLTESLWLTKMELEATRLRVHEEIKARDDQLNQLQDLLNDAINERNEARNNYQSLLLDKMLVQQHNNRYNHHKTTAIPPQPAISSVEDEPIANSGFSSSDCEESMVSSPIENQIQLVLPTKGLPEQGRFLEAVMKAGPLLQNLLLAGSLPHWRHPPPQLNTFQIPSPPFVISTQSLRYDDNCFEFNKKRGYTEDSVSSTETKYQRISLN